MAKFNATGIEGLEMSLEQFLSLPDEAVDAILEAQGKVIAAAQKAQIQSIPLVNTGRARDSIAVFKKVRTSTYGYDNERYVDVYPEGLHGAYNRKKVTKTHKRTKRKYTVGGDRKSVTNQDVLFIHEYGAPRRGIKARHWQRDANDKSAEVATAAGQAALDKYLESKNL